MKPRLLFIYLRPSSFVQEDEHILRDDYELVHFHFGRGYRDASKPGLLAFAATLMRQIVWLLRELPRAAGVYGWFSDYHMVLPVMLSRLFRRPVAVAVGGFDAISLPTLDYGVVLSRWRWPLARFVIRNADLLLPVSPSLVYSRNRFSEWPRETEQGLRAFVPDARTDIHVVPTGYDPTLWEMGPLERDALVTTVGLIDSDQTLRRKGVDLLFETARVMPDVVFRVVGVSDPEAVSARYAPPDNVELVRPVNRAELVAYYQETAVYLQLSRAEGLPNVLCEAMLCGCIPVGSRVFGIPDGIGDVGFVVDEPDAGAVSQAVRTALAASPERREAARAHIQHEFHIDRRRKTLLTLVHRLTDRHAN